MTRVGGRAAESLGAIIIILVVVIVVVTTKRMAATTTTTTTNNDDKPRKLSTTCLPTRITLNYNDNYYNQTL